jgi:hypothetical protein
MTEKEYMTKVVTVIPGYPMKEVPFGSTSDYVFISEDNRSLEDAIGDMSILLNTDNLYLKPAYINRASLVNAINYLYNITK